MTRAALPLASVLAVAVAITVGSVGGAGAFASFALFVLSAAPGLPLGFALFGRRHACGWIAGALLGYASTCLAVWAVVFTGHPGPAAFVASWLGVGAASLVGARLLTSGNDARLAGLPPWSRRDTTALLLVLMLVPLLIGRPLARIGSLDPETGDLRYRAYFTADFVWHAALTAELRRYEPRPINPYLAPEPIHYYWTYFLVPAAAGSLVDADVERSLKVNAIGTALLLVSAVFLAAWVALPAHALAVAGALYFVILAASAEGLAALAYVVQQGQGLAGLRDLNVDALSRGVGGLRIDNLPRAMWYTPQHSMSYALGLMALPVGIAAGLEAGAPAILVAGLLLGASVAFNPFVGGLLCAVYGLTVLGHWWRRRGPFSPVLRHAIAVMPVAAALAWAALNGVADGAGGTLHFGPYGPGSHSPLLAFGLSFGPLVVLVAAGLMPNRRVALAPVWPALAGAALVVAVMHLVTMTVDEFWIGFRTGHLFFVLVPPLVARGLIWLADLPTRGPAAIVVGGLFICGVPTTVIDAFNAQDVENTHEGIGLTWTLRLTPEQQAGLAWLRRNTLPDAIVQAEPVIRGRDAWSLIPSFAERRMAAGEPISLMHVPEYDIRSDEVQKIYAYADAERAWHSANVLGIDYLWVDRLDREGYPNVAKFGDHPDWFSPVFTGGDVVIYKVTPDDSARTSGTR
ncbi:MAG TPA: hypothetical protein VM032_17050 [Vicinamibacterales bacterium]|nr:hypothetical protein [Vicinamibacterales bacterium]